MAGSGPADPGSNPGRAIKLGIGKSDFGIRLADEKGSPLNLEDLSQDRLKKLVTLVSETRKSKYKRNRKKKYGTLNKGFTDEELTKFFSFCNNPKAYLAFFLMANLGLRVGEVVEIKLADLDFNKNKIIFPKGILSISLLITGKI